MKFRRILPVIVAGGAAMAMVTGAFASENWRMAHKMPPDSPEGMVFQKFADLVEEHSNGELTITVYPNEQLGKTEATMEQLKLGTVHLYAEGSTYMKKWVNEITWTSAAFLFDDRDHWVRFMNSDMVKEWYERAANEAGVGVLGDPTAILRGPYRVMVTQRDVRDYEDVSGTEAAHAPEQGCGCHMDVAGRRCKDAALDRCLPVDRQRDRRGGEQSYRAGGIHAFPRSSAPCHPARRVLSVDRFHGSPAIL